MSEPEWKPRSGGVGPSVAVGALLLASVAALCWVAVDRIEARTRRDVEATLEAVLNTTHSAVRGWAWDRQSDARRLAARSDVRDSVRALTSLAPDRETISAAAALRDLRRIMRPFLDEDRDLGFFVVSPDGINVASVREVNLGEKNVISTLRSPRSDALADVLDGRSRLILPFPSEVPLPSVGGALREGEPTMFVGVPVLDEDGSVLAALLIRIDPSLQFTRITQLARTGETGDTYAFDRLGVLVSEGRFDDQLREVQLLRADQRSILSLTLRDPGGNMLEGFRPDRPRSELPLTHMAADATSGRDGVDASGYRDYRGVPVVGAWLWDPELQLGMTAEIDFAEAFDSYFATRRTVLGVLSVTLLLFLGYSAALLVRNRREERVIARLGREIAHREAMQADREHLIEDLKHALDSIKTLKGLLPICAGCKKVRDDSGLWRQIEAYISQHSEAELSHGMCPDCMERFYPELWEEMKEAGEAE